jgi:hypothetical protein
MQERMSQPRRQQDFQGQPGQRPAGTIPNPSSE